jgi:hypothetical protein
MFMNHQVILVWLALLTTSGSAIAGNLPRQNMNFNQAWQFQLGDHPGAQTNGYNDASWNTVGLPHSFSLPYFLWSQFYTGYGWYRKHFTVPAEWSGKRVYLEFEAAFQDAQVYVNGQLIGEHLGGYTGFSYDITSAIVAGDNVVAVRLNNNWNAQLAPRNGDHTFSGGLYRDVNLVVTDPLHVIWYGTFVTTPTVSASSATVNIKTEIRNDYTTNKNCTLQTVIMDTNGATVTTVSSTQTVPANSTVTFNQTTAAIANPSLWHPDHPTLYRAVSTISDGVTNLDNFTTTFGFRWFSWTTSGFSLNGSHYYLHGANVHQDHAGWGDGVANSGFFRDVKMVKDAGLNFVRGSHYPKDPAFGDACDQLGVLFWSENCFWGSGNTGTEGTWDTAGAYPNNAGDQAAFNASVTNSLAEMIRVHRNHPSIVAWSLCNEPFFTASSTMTQMRALLTNEVALTHQLDPTRPAAIGGCQRPTDSTRIDLIGDIAGYNGDGATISTFQNPGIPCMVTEYGSVTATRPGGYDPGWGDMSSTLTNGFPIEYSWRSGQAVWCAFDHGTIKDASFGIMGIVDYFRLPKRAWYWYRNAYAGVSPPAWPGNGTPAALQLAADKTNLVAVDGTDDAQLIVTVRDANGNAISNNVPINLSILSGPGEFPTGTNITFTPPSSSPQSDIAIRDGKAAIEFRSYYAGTTVINAASPGLTNATITITSQGSPAWVAGVTPPAPARPYSRYNGGGGSGTSLTLALNHPTTASSTAAGTSASANDGDTNTAWLAAGSDPNAWWSVDLESAYAVSLVQLVFPTSGNYRYTVDVSPDGSQWTTVVNQTATSNTDQARTAVGNFGGNVRFVRVSFKGLPAGQPAGLAEVVVGGGTSTTFKANELGGTIIGTAGSYNNGGNTKEMAMDQDLNTYFDAPSSTGGNNCWVGIDFGAGVSNAISQINYCPRSDSIFPGRMVGGVFQGANQPDFSGAVALFTISATPTSGALTAQMITNTKAFRYVRYLSPNGGWGNIAEEEFYSSSPGIPTNLTAAAGDAQATLNWNASANATGYNVKRATTSGGSYAAVANNYSPTNFTNTGLSNGTIYYYVVSATNATTALESGNSVEVAVRPFAADSPTMAAAASGGQLQLNWPYDHTGWLLQAQTNNPPNSGLGTNWVNVSGSNATNQDTISISSTNGSVFFRLVSP